MICSRTTLERSRWHAADVSTTQMQLYNHTADNCNRYHLSQNVNATKWTSIKFDGIPLLRAPKILSWITEIYDQGIRLGHSHIAIAIGP